MKAFEVGHLGGIASFHQRLKSRLNERRCSSTEDSLLAEEISFGLFLEGGLNHAATGSTDALRPGEGDLFRIFPSVLVDGNQRRHTFALGELPAHDVSRSLRCYHDDVNVLWRDDGLEVNAETVSKEKGFPGSEIRGNVLLIGGRLFGVRNSHHDHVGKSDRLTGVIDCKSIVLCDFAALAAAI